MPAVFYRCSETKLKYSQNSVNFPKVFMESHFCFGENIGNFLEFLDSQKDFHRFSVTATKFSVDFPEPSGNCHKNPVAFHRSFVNIHRSSGEFHKRARDFHKSFMDFHRRFVNFHRSSVEFHKCSADFHNSSVDCHGNSVEVHRISVTIKKLVFKQF